MLVSVRTIPAKNYLIPRLKYVPHHTKLNDFNETNLIKSICEYYNVIKLQ